MRLLVVAVILAAVFVMDLYAQNAQQLAAFWDEFRVSDKMPSDMRHADVKRHIAQISALGVSTKEVGRSFGGREIYQMEWGRGPLKVFMWSQMHGDEPTATPALFDLFTFLQKNKDVDWVKKIAETMTVRAVPMLNPDGAEVYQRRNMQGIDINRDAINLTTPEARLLKQLRDDWNPAIGFNLHNQQELTVAGRSTRQAAISLLVVFGDLEKTMTPGHERNQRLASAMVRALREFIPGHIGRYADEWTPTAFGDNFSAWGTPTILVETGALHGKDEMFLVKMNFIAFLTALNSIATGSEANESPTPYVILPENASGMVTQLVFRRANIVTRDEPVTITTSDISVRFERRRASFVPSGKISNVAPAVGVTGLDEYDASGFFVEQRFRRLKVGELAEFMFFKRDRAIDWNEEDLAAKFPPDAIFSAGKWIKGEALVPKIKR
jgi:hypothetical protein